MCALTFRNRRNRLRHLRCCSTVSLRPRSHIRDYIGNSWTTLSRSMSECKSVADIKVQTTAPVLYLPADLPTPPAVAAMHDALATSTSATFPASSIGINEVRHTSELPVEGLLYLPNRYVVPGGRFNEMYGWDSYFILLGLVHDKQPGPCPRHGREFLLRDRTLRCNPKREPHLLLHPLPTALPVIHDQRGVRALRACEARSRNGLSSAYAYAQRDYALWTLAPASSRGTTGLARYHDLGARPGPRDGRRLHLLPRRHPLATGPSRTEHPEYLVVGQVKPTPAQAVTLARTSCDPVASKVCAASRCRWPSPRQPRYYEQRPRHA